LPSLRHSSLAFFCRISSDIGVFYLVVQRVRPHLFNQIAVNSGLPRYPQMKGRPDSRPLSLCSTIDSAHQQRRAQ
jgi:hypothetical protein